jgi:hypothetical protein
MMRKFLSYLTCLFVLSIVACSAKPKLVENAKYRKVGSSMADGHIESCMNEAAYKLEGRAAITKKQNSAIAGSAASAATSGILSGATTIGSVNLSGSASDGFGNAVTSIMDDRSDDPKFRRLVDSCLRSRGFRVSSWD